MEDIMLVQQCLEGNREAFEPIIARYKGLVYSIALRSTKDREEAMDIAQDVFLKVWTHLSSYDPSFPMKAWIARIAMNHCINLSRKNRPVAAWDDEMMERIPAVEGMPEQSLLDFERRRAVQDAVDSLPEMYQEPIRLFHDGGLSYEEICIRTGVPMTIVKNRIFRARKMLAARLAEYAGMRRRERGCRYGVH